MSITRAGITTPTRLAPRVTWTPQTGNVLVETWEMAAEHYDAFVLGVQQAGLLSFNKTEQGGKITVELSYGVAGADAAGQQTIADPLARVWTQHWNVDQVSIWSIPEVEAELKKLGDPRFRALFRRDVEAYLAGDTEVPDPNDSTKTIPLTLDSLKAVMKDAGIAPPGSGQNNAMDRLFDALSRGVESKLIITPVLRKTITVTGASSLRASTQNLGKLYTSATLAAEEPTLNSAALIDAAGLQSYVWLKMGPEVTDLTRGQFEIVQEWWGFQEAEEFLYGKPI